MPLNQRCFASSLRSYRGKTPSDIMQKTQKKTDQVRRKGTERWQRVMSSNLVKLIPQGHLPNGSKGLGYRTGKKKSIMEQFRATVRKMFPFYQKASKKPKRQGDSPSNPEMSRTPPVSRKHHLLPRIVRELSSPKILPKLKRRKLSQNAAIKLDVNIIEEHAQGIDGTSTVVQARRMTRRISVVSLPPGMQKALYPAKKKHYTVLKKKKKNMPSMWYHSDITVGKLQMQVDNLLDNISEKSIQLLALRSAELQQCESLGDKILQSSKQFQRVSLRTTKKLKLKNMCFLCRCCC
ncbi:putative uncharacterized protein C3orf49 homolog [Hemicordylus capensis]|uniref:putative uncharacterized protein C3orf49 homolog n=1 Tax=Hemicordylus capensis TaxID=884348 RepID=UPI002303F4E3|nr:putative uncharacterized protein C3orf49 homolog [Hemicordylus capensis]